MLQLNAMQKNEIPEKKKVSQDNAQQSSAWPDQIRQHKARKKMAKQKRQDRGRHLNVMQGETRQGNKIPRLARCLLGLMLTFINWQTDFSNTRFKKLPSTTAIFSNPWDSGPHIVVQEVHQAGMHVLWGLKTLHNDVGVSAHEEPCFGRPWLKSIGRFDYWTSAGQSNRIAYTQCKTRCKELSAFQSLLLTLSHTKFDVTKMIDQWSIFKQQRIESKHMPYESLKTLSRSCGTPRSFSSKCRNFKVSKSSLLYFETTSDFLYCSSWEACA